MKRFLGVLVGLLAGLGISLPTMASPAVATDIERLTQESHRLVGSASGESALSYIEQRLRLADVTSSLEQSFPVLSLDDDRSSFSVSLSGDASYLLERIQPNVVVPVTVGEPIRAPLVYIGRGELSEIGNRSLRGSIVALEYDCGTNWERAFARGARAVLFLGSGDETAGPAKHAPVPLNLPRFYVNPLNAAAFRQDHAEATIESQPTPTSNIADRIHADATNLVALIPGTDPGGEAIVVTAPYDTFGVVPTRSPGSRGAANVSGLLSLAETLNASPPKRDVWLLFEDAGAHRHRGARVFYDAVLMDEAEHDALVEQHDHEAQHFAAAIAELDEQPTFSRWLRLRLQATADAARADLDRQRQLLRRQAASDVESPAALETLTQQIDAWDRVRRWLNGSEAWAAAPADAAATTLVEQLRAQTRAALVRRLDELAAQQDRDAERAALRDTLRRGGNTMPRVVLHIDLDLSDVGSTWSAVTGDWSDRRYAFRAPASEADAPGYHVRVLAALRQIAEDAPRGTFTRLDSEPLGDLAVAKSFVPGRFINAGSVAGAYGIYHVALMTGHDARVRDGQPSDTPENFDFGNFEAQLDEAITLIAAAADAPGLSIRSAFSVVASTRRSGWDGQRSTGPLVTRRVTGGLSESRPAAGVAVALWPGDKGDRNAAWRVLSPDGPADTSPFDLVRTNAHGRFELLGLRPDIDAQVTAFAYELNEHGELSAVPTQATLAHRLTDAIRVDLFAGQSFGMTWWGGRDDAAGDTTLLRASSDAAYRPNLSLVGRAGRQRFWVLADRAIEPGVKLFEAQGPVALGVEETTGEAEGVQVARFAEPAAWAEQTASDMWRLNESRLAALRQRGVTSPDLEVLHAAAGRALDDQEVDASQALRSAALSQRVYPRVRSTMDDLVYAIVVLLLLTIPFAFAMERLVIGAAGVYGRIAGFVAVFLVTFGVLYATHPGFAVASTPVMIFLAFAIVLLSCMVIWVLVRRFQTELTVMQGRASASGGAAASGGGFRGVGVAVSMGMSTMRRRPTRTVLTATTVVMLTFTVLCFASVQRQIGVRSVALGPATEAMPSRAVMVRKLDAGPMSSGAVDVLAGVAKGEESEHIGHGWIESWWRVPTPQDDRPIVIAHPDNGRSVRLGGVMGIDPALLEVWPLWSDAFDDTAPDLAASLESRSVWLPTDALTSLGLGAGDAVLVDGRLFTVAGATDGGALSRLRQVDGGSWLPIDVAADAALRRSAAQPSAGSNETSGGKVLRLAPTQVALASNAVVQELGGDLRSLTRWAGDDEEPREVAADVATITGGGAGAMPVWVTGSAGAERLTLGNTTQVSGVWRLVAPVLLGGLIIFGTLLGSIADRQKEIYTFSALGLGPKHVGMLFFAEAAVYAVVGGLGGQLLAQVVALGASWMSAWGWIQPVSINFASTQALFAIGVVMATVMVSAIYPAIRASKSANPGLARAWTMPSPEPAPRDHELKMTFPFTVSAYDLTGVVAFLAEHFREHADAGLGPFAASNVGIALDEQGQLRLSAEVALAPFDLGVTQALSLTGVPSDIPGVDEVAVHLERLSGTKGDWVRANRVFIKRLRRQFLVWRTLPAEAVEAYRLSTLEILGESENEATAKFQVPEAHGGGVALA